MVVRAQRPPRSGPRPEQRGFTLLVVIVVLAVVALVSAVFLGLVRDDLDVGRQNRINWEARDLAEAANYELVSDSGVRANLPDMSTLVVPSCSTGASPCVDSPSGSILDAPATTTRGRREYTGEVRFLRWTFLPESSTQVTRGLLYEFRTTGKVGNDDGVSESRSQVSMITTVPLGTLLPKRHAR